MIATSLTAALLHAHGLAVSPDGLSAAVADALQRYGAALYPFEDTPISVIDLDRARAPFSIALTPKGTVYVFNTSGQELDVSNLLCLHDADGPCANAVKDSQRTKTNSATIRTLSVVWGFDAAHTATTVRWYRAILDGVGAQTEGW